MKGKRFLSLLLCLVMLLGLLPNFSVRVNAAAENGYPDVSFYLDITAKDGKGASVTNALTSAKLTYYGTDDGLPTQTVKKVENEDAISYVNDPEVISEKLAAGYDLPVSLAFKLKDTYRLASDSLTLTFPDPDTDEMVTAATAKAVKDETGVYTVTFTPAKAANIDDGTVCYINIVLELIPTYTVTFYPVPGNKKVTITKNDVPDGSTLTVPTDVELQATSEKNYFTIMQPTAWYTEEPVKSGSTYQYNDDKLWNMNAPVKSDLTLYSKNSARKDAKIKVLLSAQAPKKITELPSNSMTNKEQYYYNVKTESFDTANWANVKNYLVTLPVGVALTKEDLDGIKLPVNKKFAVSAGVAQPETEATIDGWKIDSNRGYLPLVEGYEILPEQAIALIGKKYDYVSAYAQIDWPITISFTTNVDGETLEPLSLIVNNKISGSGMGSAVLTDAQKESLAAVNQWAKDQEAKKDSKKIFRGWYPNKAFEGEYLGSSNSSNKYDLPANEFWSSMDLYARWVTKYSVSFDMNQMEVSNASDFTAYDVGEGELLTAPTTIPLASSTEATFEGWYKEKECKTAWNFDSETVKGDTVLYAKWNVNARKIKVTFGYYLPDDSGNDQLQTVESKDIMIASGYKFGTLPKLPGNEEKYIKCDDDGVPIIGPDGKNVYGYTYRLSGETRGLIYTGWQFTGMYGLETLTEDTVLAELIGSDTNELIITAVSKPFVTFTFDLQGGTLNDPDLEAPQVSDSCKAYNPGIPVKGDTPFLGWYTDPKGTPGTKFEFDTVYNFNTTVYAVWETEKEYKLIFDISEYPDATVALKKGDDVCTGTSADGKITYDKLTCGKYQYSITLAGYKPLIGSQEIVKDSPEIITIPVKNWPTFVPVTGITLNIPNNQIMQRKAYDLSSLATVTPENASVQNIVWSVKTANDGVSLNEDAKTLTVSDTAVGSVTLTATIANGKLNSAQTAEEDYIVDFTLRIVAFRPTITFRNGSGEGPSTDVIQNMPAPVLAVNGKITAPATKPTVDGWEFEAWYLDAAYNTEWDADHVFTQDSELFAKWKKEAVPITVTFSDGGSQTKTETHNAGESLVLPPNMFTKAGYIFVAWELPDETTMYAGTTIKALPSTNVTYKATWKEINAAITADDVRHSLDAITAENAKDHKPQLVAARDALAAGTATKTDAELIGSLSELFKSAGLGPVSITGTASQGVTETGAILSTDGAAVVLNVNKLATPSKTLPEAYQNEEYKSVWYTVSMSVGGATTEPKVPVILTVPIPADLSTMAADTIRVLLYKSAAAEPVVMTPTVSGSNLTFAFDGNGQIAFVGKAISDTADTRVTGLTMEYNGTKMGNVTQDKDGNFTVVLPASLNQSAIDLLSSGKWKTYLTVAPQAKVATAESKEGFDATYWAETGVALTYSLTKTNDYSDSRTLTAIAKNGTTRTFTVTVKKITDADRTYKIAVSNISGGTVTATPNPAAAGEEVKLTIEPNDGKKLVAGSLKYSLQSAGAAPVAIDESTLTFIMPAGDININAEFEDDASAPIKNPPQITAFMINGVSAVINHDTKAITIILPYGTDLRHVAPTIVTANASKVEPSSAQRVDLSTPKAYRVYASNGAYVTYTVTAYTEEPSPTQSLWEKLQNQINSNPNWWELAEYQKKTGYYK